MENPLTGMELFVGGLTGILGFISADLNDRFWATHKLGPSILNPGPGNYGDSPPATGSYAGLYNATAVLAPMDLKRWASGLALAGLPFLFAHFVRSGTSRSALQFFGFGAGMRVLGKGSQDLMAMLLLKTGIGQRLYDGEMRGAAQQKFAKDPSYTFVLPQSGLGAPAMPQYTGCGSCLNCATGVGACCGNSNSNPGSGFAGPMNMGPYASSFGYPPVPCGADPCGPANCGPYGQPVPVPVPVPAVPGGSTVVVQTPQGPVVVPTAPPANPFTGGAGIPQGMMPYSAQAAPSNGKGVRVNRFQWGSKED